MQYQFESLKNLCEKSLSKGIAVDNAVSIFLLANMHNAAELKSKSIEFIVKNSKQVMATEGWKEILKPARMDLIAELFQAMANLTN